MKRILFYVAFVLSLILAIVSYVILPDIVAVKFNFSGQVTNTMPKLLFVLLLILLDIIGLVMSLVDKDISKGLSISVVCIISFVVILIINLK